MAQDPVWHDVRAHIGQEWLGTPIMPFDDPWYRFGRILRELDDSLSVQPGSRWLDLGCHQGQFARLVAKKYGVIATGIDDWSPALKVDTSWTYLQRDLGREFNVEGSFRYISALEVLEHIIDTDAFLARCYAQLEPGGYFVLSTPNINSLRNRITIPLGAYPAGLEYRNVIHHVRLYNVGLLRAHLQEHGFSVRWIRGVSFFPLRMLARGLSPEVDRVMANRMPQLCNNIIALAQKGAPATA